MNEIWKDIKGYEGLYQVSNLGRVRSLDRKIFNRGNNSYCYKKGVVLKPNKDKGGYLYVGLSNRENIKCKSVKIHRLVALHFCGDYEDGLQVNHIDGNRQNNKFDNLEWVTAKVNIRHKFIIGYKMGEGENNPSAKLRHDHIPIIVSLYLNGVSQRTISKCFGVSQSTISNIIRLKHYKNYADRGLAVDSTKLEGGI